MSNGLSLLAVSRYPMGWVANLSVQCRHHHEPVMDVGQRCLGGGGGGGEEEEGSSIG